MWRSLKGSGYLGCCQRQRFARSFLRLWIVRHLDLGGVTFAPNWLTEMIALTAQQKCRTESKSAYSLTSLYQSPLFQPDLLNKLICNRINPMAASHDDVLGNQRNYYRLNLFDPHLSPD